ncbi:unnamed protein product [Alternaria alternata]
MKDFELFEPTRYIFTKDSSLKKVLIVSMFLITVHGRDELGKPFVVLWGISWQFFHFFITSLFIALLRVTRTSLLIATMPFIVVHSLLVPALVSRKHDVARPKVAGFEAVLHFQSYTLNVPAQLHIVEQGMW